MQSWVHGYTSPSARAWKRCVVARSRMDLKSLQARYKGGVSPSQIAPGLLEVCTKQKETFLHVPSAEEISAACQRVEGTPADARGALWGCFFAVKDNIDVAGMPTTAACPAFSYTPTASAPVVTALEAAGCICLGKVNMDQFAAGLNGTRSPYGVPKNAVDARVIPGGSSSGSAVAVATGVVTFALGTDTAGSGRVPAGLNGIVGMKPSVGMVSTLGVVPACGSIDCVTAFCHNVLDGGLIMTEMSKASAHPSDHTLLPSVCGPSFQQWAALAASADAAPLQGVSFKFAVPQGEDLKFGGPRGDVYVESCMQAMGSAALRLEALGGQRVDLDFQPLCKLALMLYGSALVSERYAGISSFLEGGATAGVRHRSGLKDIGEDERLLPVTRKIINGAGSFSSVDVYNAQSSMRSAAGKCRELLKQAVGDESNPAMPFLVVPTVMHHYTAAELSAQEAEGVVSYNSHLGTFTNFVNLLGMCGVSVPFSTFECAAPDAEAADGPMKVAFGITIVSQGGNDEAVWRIAHAFQQQS